MMNCQGLTNALKGSFPSHTPQQIAKGGYLHPPRTLIHLSTPENAHQSLQTVLNTPSATHKGPTMETPQKQPEMAPDPATSGKKHCRMEAETVAQPRDENAMDEDIPDTLTRPIRPATRATSRSGKAAANKHGGAATSNTTRAGPSHTTASPSTSVPLAPAKALPAAPSATGNPPASMPTTMASTPTTTVSTPAASALAATPPPPPVPAPAAPMTQNMATAAQSTGPAASATVFLQAQDHLAHPAAVLAMPQAPAVVTAMPPLPPLPAPHPAAPLAAPLPVLNDVIPEHGFGIKTLGTRMYS
ncbi:hypothetical protein BDN71DRAFT_1510383 [Pleurotus eryngii]|uniref:Uncharacterized protein n=1 Tax=Pleurotus eryngii TaxID=5323 RepID=A0A9P6DD51_PLEER|nr:hypothetical protein BDN71DRAFT_1510383 [Pleurotus eryngii]